MKKIVTLSFVFVLLSCYSVDLDQIDNLNQGKIYRIGHGGSGFVSWVPFNAYPSNSMIGIKQALEAYKADGIEVDVHMTDDREFVLYHDKMLDSKSDQKGYIELQNWSDIKGAKYQVGFPFDWFQNEEIILLDSLLSYAKTLDDFPIIQLDLRSHCECFGHKRQYIRANVMFRNLIKKLDEFEVDKNKLQIITGFKDLIELSKIIGNEYPMLFEVGEFESGLEWALENDIKHMVVNRPILDAEASKKAHSYGISITTFQAKSDQGHQQLILKNPDYIQSNNLASLNRMLGIE